MAFRGRNLVAKFVDIFNVRSKRNRCWLWLLGLLVSWVKKVSFVSDTVVTSALVVECHGACMLWVFSTASHVMTWLAHGDLKEQN